MKSNQSMYRAFYEENWEEELASKYYQLKLDSSRIHLIETHDKLLEFLAKMDDLSHSEPIYVGVDSEWKPTCVSGVSQGENANKVALIQVSTHTDVYLLDMMSLCFAINGNYNDDNGKLLVKRFFTNKRVIKIGYGFSHDIRVILLSIGCLHDADAFRQTVLDLAYLVNHVSCL